MSIDLPQTIAERQALLKRAQAAGLKRRSAELPAIERVDRRGRLPLSFAQQRLWFLEQMGGLGSTYHIPGHLSLRGALDREALVRALDRLVARHESLRTTFAMVNGEPEQRIGPETTRFHLAEHDLAGEGGDALQALMAREAAAPFDLERGPLIRGRLVRLAEEEHLLLLTMHHIVSDGWSMGVLVGELGRLYAAFRDGRPDPLPPLPVQYADYAAWQRRWLDGEVLEQQAACWKRRLAGAPALLELPTDHPRPQRQDHAGGYVGVALDEPLSEDLKALGRRHGATPFMTLLAGWAVVLSRLSGQDEVVIGTPTASRGRREIEGLIGFFVNTLALRIDLSGRLTVARLLEQVKARALEAQQNQDIPFEQVVERVDPVRTRAHTPLFQVMFAWQNARSGMETPGRVAGAERPEPGRVPAVERTTTKFNLSLTLSEADGRIVGGVTYATSLFERATVERHVGYLRRVLEQMAADDARPVDGLELLPESERRLVLRTWSAGEAAAPPDACIHALFQAQAERTPDAPALVHEDGELTYAQLEARANRLAHHLRRLGVGPEARVGVSLEWGPELVVALLATLKAGGVYVPLDPSLPPERRAYMAADAGVVARVTRAALAGGAGAGVAVRVDVDAERIAAEPAGPPAPGVHTDGLAYLIYTSGSTGRPKGVAVEHGPAAAHFRAMARALGIVREDRVLQFASAGFDVSLEQVFVPLLAGATLVLRGAEPWSPAEFSARVHSLGVTVANVPPAYWQEVLAAGEPCAVRLLLVGGDALPAAAAAAGAETRLLNLYGPTETVVTATAFAVPHGYPERFPGSTAPIGRPLPGRAAYVLDRRGEPVPPGVAGELYLGGLLARGYLGRPGLTADRFVPDPFGRGAGARLYRTGDRVRWSAKGELEFLGRADFQVKVRGFRIEPGEIETRLLEHPGVRAAAVVAREDVPGDTRLVAYYAGEAREAQALRAHLAERLPEYMVPAAYVHLEALPITPTGKVDRKALPAPQGDAFATRGYEAPRGETEQALAEIWSELLGVEPVGRWDHFFDLGGHSLLAVRVISRVRQVLGAQVELGAVFQHPVLNELAEVVAAAGRAALPPIERADRGAPLPLSYAQQRLWFLEQMGGLGSAYHVSRRMRLRGELDRDALVRALDRLVARHEALRTTFPSTGGEPEQRIGPETTRFPLVEHDLAGQGADAAGAVMAREAAAPFDLERGPLIRGVLIRLAPDDHVLLLRMHHIVSDGWSAGVLVDELSALYAAFRAGLPDPLSPLPIQYADYAAWQRRWVQDEVLEGQASYWTGALSGAPALLELPADHPRPQRQDHAGAAVRVELDEALTAGLKALSRRNGTTLFMTLLAGWAAVLGRLSGQPEVVIGTPTANRGRREVEGLIGFFVNTLALRVDLSDRPTVARLLERVRARALEAQQNQDIPFEQVVERLDPVRTLAHTPLFQVLFTWQNTPRGGLALPGLELGRLPGAERTTAKFDLSLSLAEVDGRVGGAVTYATSLFEQATVERHVGYLRRVLEQMAADDARAVDRLELLPEAERRLVVEEWNREEAAYPRDACVHELFEAQVERTPDAVAVVFDEHALSYAELNRRANRLAHHLRSLGVGPDARVGLCLERSPEMVVGVLGVLKAGGAWVPLDPSHPAERLRYLLRDAAPRVVLTQSSTAAALEGVFAGLGVQVLALDAPAWQAQPASNPQRGALTPAHLAYVSYTSGSTGEPKGVMVAHGGVVNLVHWMKRRWPMDGDHALLQKTPLTFDVSVWELFWPLVSGARLVVARPEGHRDPGYLADVIRRERITAVAFVPSMLQLFLDADVEGCGTLKWVMSGGEALTGALARRLHERLPAARLYNRYAPTEATVNVVAWRCGPGEAGASIPIGRPRANIPLYILDAGGEPVPVGVTGELHIGGVQVARGYQGRPGLTAERFVPDPFARAPGARLYRTGDLACWRADGAVELVGRDDFQVKLRGLRVELGEIEARLREHPGVREAVVLAREDAPGDRRLVAYCVAGEPLDVEALRRHAAERLPEYMVPAAYVRMERLPLTPNGKLDRGALPAPEGGAFARRGYEAPVGETEQALAEIWSEVLGVERVGRWDDFFELGGHSLLAVRVVSRVRQLLGAQVELGAVFQHPVLRELAEALAAAGRADLPPIEPVDRAARLPLSYAQQRLWFLEQMGGLGSAYHVARRLRLRGALDREALARALDRLVARHEALRTTFRMAGGSPGQWIAPVEESAFSLRRHDLPGGAQALPELRRLMADEAAAPFDLERGPLIRGRLIRLDADDHVLLLTMHHIVSDGWSAGVLVDELGRLYGAFREGRPDPLPPLPIQYADYAAWQRRWVEAEVLERQAGYWTRTLAGAPAVLELPADHPRPPRQDHAGDALRVAFDPELTAGLRALGRRHGTTLFMTLLAGWAAVLARVSGQDDVVIGTPTANRGRREIEGLIGFFVNTLALRIDLAGAPTVARLLERVRARALEAQQNQDIPFEQVVERVDPVRTMAHAPLFQVLFAWQSASGSGLRLPGLEVEPVPGAERTAAQFDLSLVLGESDGRITGSLTFATSLYERATVERYAGYLRRVLEQMAADDARPVDRLALLPAEERRLVVEEWNRTEAAHPPGACIHQRFQAQVERTPHAAAVAFGDAALSYAELNRRANRLAHHLRALGVGPDARVGLCVERGLEMVVGLLAVLKAGGAYVPLDPDYPDERLRHTLADSRPVLLLTEAALRGRFAGAGVPVLTLDDGAPAWAAAPAHDPGPDGLTPDHLAYVIYTSGSTGRPKGVAVPHAAVARLFAATEPWFGFGPRDVWTLFHSFAFDFSVWEIWGALLYGGRLVVVDRETARSPADFHRLVCREGVTILNQTPSAFRALIAADAASGEPHALREVIFGGEALETATLRPWFARHGDRRPRLVNMYGITETTVHVTFHPLAAADAERSGPGPIGRRIPDLRAYVLDRGGEAVPIGVAGELYVGGAGLARGYLGRPGLTAERFVPDPFGAVPGARLYRTGDLARWRADGTLEYLGRNDQQVKIRGFRIEPGEVEARLAEHPAVRDAVVVAREDTPGDRRLVAYYVAREPVGADLLRAHLGERLAEHMVPAAYVPLDAIPLTPNGKLDRAALPAPDGDAYARGGYEAPVGETEAALAEIWAEVLGVERVGRGDNFFELGGHSLLVIHLIERMRQRGLHAEVRALFVAPTLAALAAEVGERTPGVEVPANLIPAPEPGTPDAGEDEMEFIV
jgi:amino acid adenylation domain-containing protein